MLNVSIRTPEETLLIQEAETVFLPGKLGFLTILKNHAPCLIELSPGDIKVQLKSEEKKFPIESGFVKVFENQVVILVA